MFYKILFVSAVLLLSNSFAQLIKESTPEEVCEESLKAIEDKDYYKYASLLHPDALLKIREFANIAVSSEEGDPIVLGVFGAKDLTEFKMLSDTVLMAKFIEYSLSKTEREKSVMGFKTQLIGKINEGKDTIHVLTRIKMLVPEMTITKLDITTLKKSEAGWRLLLKEDFDMFISAMRRYIDQSNQIR